ncbi:MAG: metal-dependent phosphohydrolase [Cytophagales bacterium]|nr:metal-dependent phosphohydrolase [Cytophagales bacterium]MCA6382348.1 metal-dependent phosphohydrolase [Cytophagales bacterium]
MEFLSQKQQILLEFVKLKHGGQLRKYTNLPYYTHLVNVAEIVSKHVNDEISVETALCHDLFEDTECREFDLSASLLQIGYPHRVVSQIVSGVWALTDVYTSAAFPTVTRSERKRLEAIRLGTIPDFAQSVKYADLIDNSSSIVAYDKGFAKVFLREKEFILKNMHSGDHELYRLCCETLKLSLSQL